LKETAKPPDSTVPVGLMMVDPSEWAPGAANEHPWADADEFFASARAAYVLNVKGLKTSIARATKVDRRVRLLGQELLAVLQGVTSGAKGEASARMPADRETAATAELQQIKSASRVEDTAGSPTSQQLGWLLAPETRPKRR
jgi:hypothetical protein